MSYVKKNKKGVIDLGLALLSTKEMFAVYGPGPKENSVIAALIREWTGKPISREAIRQVLDRTLRKLRKRSEGDPMLRECIEHFTKQK